MRREVRRILGVLAKNLSKWRKTRPPEDMMVGSPQRQPVEMAVAEALAGFTLKVATPIFWYDREEGWPKRIFGGTCFFLRFDNKIIGVTANHVMNALENNITQNINTVCQIRTSKPLRLLDLIIDRCFEQDLATFRLPEEIAQAVGLTVLDCTDDWPPPKPVEGRAVTFCGFPEAERTTTEPGVVNAFACAGLGVIDAVSERNLIVTYDPDREVAAPWAPWKPPLGYNMSGCSGGPVLSHGTRNGLQRWFAIATIIGGPKRDKDMDGPDRKEGTGKLGSYDLITMRRIDSIQSDGSIKNAQSGWLPT